MLVSVFIPYQEGITIIGGGDTWAYALAFLVTGASVLVVTLAFPERPELVGGFLLGAGTVALVDLLGAYVIGPTTFDGDANLKLGGFVGALGALLIVMAGIGSLSAPATEASPSSVRPHRRPPVPDEVGERPRRRLVRRIWLPAFLVSVGINTLLGIGAILSTDFGETQAKVLGSSLCITGAVLLGLACEPARVRRRISPVPLIGMISAGVGFALLLVGIWAEPGSESFWKFMGTVFAAAVVASYMSLMSLIRLPSTHPLFLVTMGLAVVLALLTVAAIWVEPEDDFWRLYGVVAVLVGAATIVTPVVSRVTRPRADTSSSQSERA